MEFLRNFTHSNNVIEVVGEQVPLPLEIHRNDPLLALLPRAEDPMPAVHTDIVEAPREITIDSIRQLNGLEEETITLWLRSFNITPDQIQNPDPITSFYLRAIYQSLLNNDAQVQRDNFIQMETDRITRCRIDSGKEAVEEWGRVFKTVRIARNRERSENEMVKSSLKDHIDETRRKVDQADNARAKACFFSENVCIFHFGKC